MQTTHLGEPLNEARRQRKNDEIERDFDASFLHVFLPPALSKGKLKDTLTLASFDILINRKFDASPFLADCGRRSLFLFLLKSPFWFSDACGLGTISPHRLIWKSFCVGCVFYFYFFFVAAQGTNEKSFLYFYSRFWKHLHIHII